MARADRERELARRNERLDEFAGTVSHDLRNPLHVATARVDMARDTGDVEHLEEVSEALDRMETLIEDLLARARGEQDVERQPLSLATAARDAWASLDTGAADLSVEGDGTLQADKNRMAQLFEKRPSRRRHPPRRRRRPAGRTRPAARATPSRHRPEPRLDRRGRRERRRRGSLRGGPRPLADRARARVIQVAQNSSRLVRVDSPVSSAKSTPSARAVSRLTR
ncbi:hypothetical protein BRD09_08325 [Halobacteriales archaeon SW_10_68_16]|nr:MAG: hypothetical protein BRD09_08325 [Halobacteriales archaeon SW_10_68_16]